jgi:3-keto-disaccharide hydrolase
MTNLSRRQLIGAMATLGAYLPWAGRVWGAESIVRFDFSLDFSHPLEDWETVSGRWAIEDVPGASHAKALVQRATKNAFNVIVAPGGPYTDADVSVRFKPISGEEDASGGIVFRFSEGRYYVIRANALEDNFNFYYYDRGRQKLSGARVKTPALGQWHTLRITAEQDRIKGWLNGQLLIDQRDRRFSSGRVGLWTKADSVTAFDDLTITPTNRG